ncbi:hypothetical protein Vretimale_12871 [Volvox reticuliferus]|uniref:Uncharacterized protein n=1 Tax=Volvox reticuliferus TaxID=1737510 RepID=A0A8J4CE74_9CHLO|nr:hypothetical protein Vretifemale_9249 [Volvox reticuliferus]GIM08971.1 hypothetical protein Vretimale_12871 [Volvox reticuliferus]
MHAWIPLLWGYKLAPHEVAAARHGFTAFGFVLSSYFILLPLREDVALTLGPAVLPRLFTASLVVTAVTAPLVTAYIVNPAAGSRAAGFQRLCRLMAGCLLGLWMLLLITAPNPWVAARLLAPRRWLANDRHSDAPPEPYTDIGKGARSLSWYGNAVRVSFYVYLSLQSLLSTSTLWAVCADTFNAATSTKVYGFLGAGATLGQLTASAAALGFGAACKATGATGASLWLLLPAAVLLMAAGQSCQAMAAKAEALHPYMGDQQPNGQPEENGYQKGLIGYGSVGRCGVSASASASDFGQAAAAAAAAAMRPDGPMGQNEGSSRRGDGLLRRLSLHLLASHTGRLVEGFRLIAASPYLLAACAFLALNYSTSATLYFLRAALVSRAGWLGGSDERIAFFAALNTASAGIIFAAQMLLTGRVLTSIGVGPTLLVGPMVSLLGMALIGVAPSPATLAGVEVVRKVVQYSLARPCREVLFTLVSRREKYAAKVVLDTVVQRLGDTAAAAVFEVVGVWLSMGPPAVAAVGLVLCGAHIAVSAALGRMYARRKAAAALAEKEEQQQQLHNL